MTGAKLKPQPQLKLKLTNECQINRNFIDALRECLGMDPLYKTLVKQRFRTYVEPGSIESFGGHRLRSNVERVGRSNCRLRRPFD